jgi:type IV secretory pathway TrbD component
VTKTMFGGAVGLVLGLVVVLVGFGQMLIVALFGIIGWAVAKALVGELDLGNLSSIGQQRRTPR